MLICDTIGLGIFTVVGSSAAIDAGYGDNRFLIVFVGVLTGVGGGMIRDMMAGTMPYIL
ncbi:MAG: TRIC cation channel family protein [Lachnospiraceae bacterium]